MKLTETNLTAMFIDIVDSTRNAEHLTQIQYVQEILMPFQSLATRLSKYLPSDKIVFECRGDEVFACVHDEGDYSPQTLADYIEYFIMLKLCWYLCDYNISRIRSSRHPIELGSGINLGKGVLIASDKAPPKLQGYTINKTKRIEALSREARNLKLVVSHSARRVLDRSNVDAILLYSGPMVGQGKGLSEDLEAYDISEYFAPGLFRKIRTEFGSELDHNVSEWEKIAKILSDLSPRHYWLSSLLVCYRYNRYVETSDVSLLKIAATGAAQAAFLSEFMMPNFVSASLAFYEKKFDTAFLKFGQCLNHTSILGVRLPRLLAAIEMLTAGAILETVTLRDLRHDFSVLMDSKISDETRSRLEMGRKFLI